MYFIKTNENDGADFDDELGGSDYIDYNLLIGDQGIVFSRSYSYLIFSNVCFFFINFNFYRILIIFNY